MSTFIVKYRDYIRILAYTVSVIIALFLAIALVGKLFYPSQIIAPLEFAVGAFEVVLLFALLIFYFDYRLWICISQIFAAWAGYSYYWTVRGLPCSCMGELMHMPLGVAMGLDAVFFALSLTLVYLLGSKLRIIYLLVLGGLFFALWGYIFGEWTNQYFIEKTYLGLLPFWLT